MQDNSIPIGVLVEFDIASASAVVFFHHKDEQLKCTTCVSAEQLWATLQAVKRPLSRIDMLRAQKRLEEAKALQARDRMDLEQALRSLNNLSANEIEIVTSLRAVKSQQAKTKLNLDSIDFDALEI